MSSPMVQHKTTHQSMTDEKGEQKEGGRETEWGRDGEGEGEGEEEGWEKKKRKKDRRRKGEGGRGKRHHDQYANTKACDLSSTNFDL